MLGRLIGDSGDAKGRRVRLGRAARRRDETSLALFNGSGPAANVVTSSAGADGE